MLIGFVQLELPGLIGLADGRYLEREADGDGRVMVVQALGAPKPAGRGRRRARPVASPDREAVPFTRVTVAGAERFADAEAAKHWLDQTAADADALRNQVRRAVKTIRLALDAYRAAAEDPLISEIGASRALAVRVGYGTGDQIADGAWTEARELPPAPPKRLGGIEPSARVADVLAGRRTVSPAETLFARVRLDMEAERPREAALGLVSVLRVLIAESRGADGGDLLDEAEHHAESALQGRPSAEDLERLAKLVSSVRELVAR